MADQSVVRREINGLVNETSQRVSLVAKGTTLLWLIEIVDSVLMSGGLDRFGVRPYTIDGLTGILFAPFLHGGFGHLIANTIPFIILGFLS